MTAGSIRRVRKTFGFMLSKFELRPSFAELALGGGDHHGGIFAGQRFDFKGDISARRAVRFEVADLEKHAEKCDDLRHVIRAAGIAERPAFRLADGGVGAQHRDQVHGHPGRRAANATSPGDYRNSAGHRYR